MSELDDSTIRSALSMLGERLCLPRTVEMLIIGGAAGILTGELPATSTTGDVDAVNFKRAGDRDAVLDVAAEVGRELLLPLNWLNDWGGIYGWTLPAGWKHRRIQVGVYGCLHPFAVARIDLIRMKFIAHREGDLENLTDMNVTADELSRVRTYLDNLAKRYPGKRYQEEAGRIRMARAYVDAW